ncbi:hypothetical protein S83_029746, partial [Arachis hypogaea]
STDDYTVSNGMISQLMNKKIVFIVDPRPVGYELNTSLHVVRAVCDDVEIVKFLEDSSHDNQQQSPGPGHCDPLYEGAPLLPKLRGYFAEFLRESCLAPLGILYLPTGVGFGYRIQFSFTPMQAFNVHQAQVLQWVRLHPFLFSTEIVGLLTMIFMQESRPHKVQIYLGVISLSLLGKSFGVLLDN